MKVFLKFWGTRGSIPTPQPECMKYGGDTPCVEVRTKDGAVLFLDAGTGIRRAGLDLVRNRPQVRRGTILLSHLHWDHIQGLPFFKPLFMKEYKFDIFGPLRVDPRLEHRLEKQMSDLFFPVNLDQIPSELTIREIVEEPFEAEGVRIAPRHLAHPDGSFGYRLEAGGRVVAYATDTEQSEDEISEDLATLARGADVLIMDSQYTPEEYPRFRGWGHSTWRAAARCAKELGVGTLVLFHHDPEHDDELIDSMVEEARRVFPSTIAAERDMELAIGA